MSRAFIFVLNPSQIKLERRKIPFNVELPIPNIIKKKQCGSLTLVPGWGTDTQTFSHYNIDSNTTKIGPASQYFFINQPTCQSIINSSVSDPYHFDADPDPAKWYGSETLINRMEEKRIVSPRDVLWAL